MAGAAGLAIGLALDRAGICPNVKRIWTPSWVLFSGGWCFLILAAFYVVIDWAGLRGLVVSASSDRGELDRRVRDGARAGQISSSSRSDTHLGQEVFQVFGAPYEAFVAGVAVLLVYWLILVLDVPSQAVLADLKGRGRWSSPRGCTFYFHTAIVISRPGRTGPSKRLWGTAHSPGL